MTDQTDDQTDERAIEAPGELPDGEYAIVEVLGHRTYVGRVDEVERFGSKLMSIEPIFQGRLLPAVLVGGGSLYQFTPCTKETAAKRGAKQDWELPQSLRAALSPTALPAPDDEGDGPEFAPAFLDED